MRASSIKGMIDIDMTFDLRLLPGVEGKQRPPTETSVKEIFSMREYNGKKVWMCLLTGTNSMSTSYFFSVVEDINANVVAFILCPAAQVYWWLCCRSRITGDVNKLI
jgi:hypothetical protein